MHAYMHTWCISCICICVTAIAGACSNHKLTCTRLYCADVHFVKDVSRIWSNLAVNVQNVPKRFQETPPSSQQMQRCAEQCSLSSSRYVCIGVCVCGSVCICVCMHFQPKKGQANAQIRREHVCLDSRMYIHICMRIHFEGCIACIPLSTCVCA